MGCGGSTQSSVQSNAPPQQFLDAYSRVESAAENAAATPLNLYPGPTIADFTDPQRAAFQRIYDLQGVGTPYFDRASSLINSATTPLASQIPTVDRATINSLTPSALALNRASTNNFGSVPILQSDVLNGLVPRGLDLTEKSLTNLSGVPEYSADGLQPYMDPYLDQVVRRTQEAFDRQNRVDDERLVGNAVASNAWGGDRAQIARAALAGEQRAAQDPVIAGLYSQGFGQAQNQFNNQQQLAQQRAAQQSALEQAAANTGFGLYTGQQGFGLQRGQAQTQAQQNAAAQLLGLLNSQQATELGAAQGSGWLGLQGAAANAGLGQSRLASDLTSANALANVGALQQQQAQQLLNVPYQQWQAIQSYPFQSIGWLSNIAQGLGSSAGNTSTTTQPSPSALSQIAGLGMGGIGLLGATGGFGSNGWLSGAFGGGSAPVSEGVGAITGQLGDYFADGGAVKKPLQGFALGGVPLAGDDPPVSSAVPVPTGIPELDISIIPENPPGAGVGYSKRNWGTTQTTTSSGGIPILGTVMKLGKLATSFADGGSVEGLGAPDDAKVSVERTPIEGTSYFGLTPKLVFNGGTLPWAEYARSLAAPIFAAPPPPVITASVMGDSDKEDGPNPIDSVYWGGGESGGMRRGGGIRGFAYGGADDDEDLPETPDFGEEWDIPEPAPALPVDAAPEARGLGAPEPVEKGFPWMALAQAGFATAAGRSPNALTNLGQGAAAGLGAYQKMRQQDAVDALRRTQAETTRAAQQERVRHNRASEQTAMDRLDAQIKQADERLRQGTAHIAIAAENAASNRMRAGRRTEADILEDTIGDLTGATNPDTGKPYTRAEAYRHARGIAGREDIARDREERLAREADDRAARRKADDEYRTAKEAQLTARMGQVNARAITDYALRLKSQDFTGRMTIQQAMEEAEKAFSRAGGVTPATPRAAPSMPPNAKQAPDGQWYVPDPNRPGKYLRVVPGGG